MHSSMAHPRLSFYALPVSASEWLRGLLLTFMWVWLDPLQSDKVVEKGRSAYRSPTQILTPGSPYKRFGVLLYGTI